MEENFIEPIINGFKVRYSILDEMVDKSKIYGERTNIFVNVDSIISRFFRNDECISAFNALNDNMILTSEMINIVAHYRHYFWSRFRMPITFIFYHCNKKPKWQKNYVPDYNLRVFNKLRDIDNPKYGGLPEAISANLKLVKLLSTYVNKAYYIESDGLEPSVIPYYIIKKTRKNTCNIIISHDKVESQLTTLDDNTIMIYPKGAKSYFINRDNIYDDILSTVKYRPRNKLSPKLYPLYLAFVGDKGRNLSKVDGFSKVKALKMIDKLIDDGVIENRHNKGLDRMMLREYLSTDQILKLRNNYKCINFSFAHKLLRNIDEAKIKNCFVDKYDNKSIMEINSKYFEFNHIKLIELCEGV